MSPYLTKSGRWILASAVIFLLLAVLSSDPVMLLIGASQVMLLATSVMLAVPGALALDRRLIALELEPGTTASTGTGHIVGDDVEIDVRIENSSDVALHYFRLEPFGASPLEIVRWPVRVLVPRSHGATASFSARGKRTGRWVVHGCDVAVTDPFALVESRDYLPAAHAFEFYPRAGRLRSRRPIRYAIPPDARAVGAHVVESIGSGTEIRELRDYQSGDSLRDIAWKTSLRTRKLIAREYEREVTSSTYIALDVSSSMRGGEWAGQKLEFAIQVAVDALDTVLSRRDKAGLITFDEKLYGHIEPGSSARHYQRLLRHLVGLSAVADPDLTELDQTELERLIADYLLVQERLDFRKGASEDSASGVNVDLLERWLRGVLPRNEEELASPVLRDGVMRPPEDLIRRFLQLRGVEIPYRVEARLGMKERGLVESLEHLVQVAREPQHIVVITDLCAVMNVEMLVRGIRVAMAKRHTLRFVVPFTPDFYGTDYDVDEKFDVIRELFTSAERDERERVASKIRSLGVRVDFVSPGEGRALA